jgi:hypothetical protein
VRVPFSATHDERRGPPAYRALARETLAGAGDSQKPENTCARGPVQLSALRSFRYRIGSENEERFSLTGADPGRKPSRTDRAPRRQAKNALHSPTLHAPQIPSWMYIRGGGFVGQNACRSTLFPSAPLMTRPNSLCQPALPYSIRGLQGLASRIDGAIRSYAKCSFVLG